MTFWKWLNASSTFSHQHCKMIASQVVSQGAPACVRRAGASRVRCFGAQRVLGPVAHAGSRRQNRRVIVYAAEVSEA